MSSLKNNSIKIKNGRRTNNNGQRHFFHHHHPTLQETKNRCPVPRPHPLCHVHPLQRRVNRRWDPTRPHHGAPGRIHPRHRRVLRRPGRNHQTFDRRTWVYRRGLRRGLALFSNRGQVHQGADAKPKPVPAERNFSTVVSGGKWVPLCGHQCGHTSGCGIVPVLIVCAGHQCGHQWVWYCSGINRVCGVASVLFLSFRQDVAQQMHERFF